MRKLLIAVLIILLCVLGYFTIFNGISIGSFEILSAQQIKDKNNKLTNEISEIETARESTYTSKTQELSKETKSLMDSKTTYTDLASVSTESELKEASQEETYLIEYLWTRIGNHATSEGVKLKLDIVSGDTTDEEVHNLNFTVEGYYIGIINFISSIENDSKLGFRIEDFKVTPGGDSLVATFTTKDVKIKKEETTATEKTEENEEENNVENNTDNNIVNDTNTSDANDNSVSGTINEMVSITDIQQ